MFENTVSRGSIPVIKGISKHLADFYLAGGTALALQLGHRKSEDFDFFTTKQFSPDEIIQEIKPDNILMKKWGTLHCKLQGAFLTFLFYEVPLRYSTIGWNGIDIADYRDIASEKLRTISERGAKKDFYDVYALLNKHLSIEEISTISKERFSKTALNFYVVLKGLTYFDDADKEPVPAILLKGKEWKWENVKKYFIGHIKEFEKYLMKPY